MKIDVFGEVVTIERGHINCPDARLERMLRLSASAPGFAFGHYFPSTADRDNFTGEQLALKYDGQVLERSVPEPPAERPDTIDY